MAMLIGAVPRSERSCVFSWWRKLTPKKDGAPDFHTWFLQDFLEFGSNYEHLDQVAAETTCQGLLLPLSLLLCSQLRKARAELGHKLF